MEVTVQEAKAQLSALLRRVEAGEEVVIRRGRKRVALLIKASGHARERRIWGDLKGKMLPGFDDAPVNFESCM